MGPMSRPMRASEIEAFVSRHGYAPTGIPVAVDALAVFVHRDNPLEGLTLAQVDAIFSDTLRRGGPDVENWSDLGLQGRWQERSFSLYGRNSASGTYGFFKTQALQQGDFRDDVHEQPGSSAVVQAVAGDLYAMGYTAVGYTTPAVRTLPIAGPNGIFYTPTEENCVGERYPLARFLYVYIDLPPDEALDDLTGEFIRYVLSDDGQRVVRRFGFFGLAPELLAQVESEILPVAP